MAYQYRSTGGAGGRTSYGAGGAGGTFGMVGSTAEYKDVGSTGGGGGGGAGAAGGGGGPSPRSMGGAGGTAGNSSVFPSSDTTDGGPGQGPSQTQENLGGGGGGGGGNGLVNDVTGPSNAYLSATGGNGGAGYSFPTDATNGGGGGGGGAGGDGFVVRSATSTSGISGDETGGNGGAGGAGFIGIGEAGGGGDGGAGVSIGAAASGFYVLLGDSHTTKGGNGGLGGVGGRSLQAGGNNSVGRGGNGGAGVAMNDGGSVYNYATVMGGNGAASAGSLTDPNALYAKTFVGAAGNGGAGIVGIGAAVYMRGGTVTGGMGGAGAEGGNAGAGGAGILGSNLNVDASSGTITGGMSGDNTTQADAITFASGTSNRLVLGGTLNGRIGVNGKLTLVTYSDATLTNVIHDTADGAGSIAYDGYGTLTVSVANAYSGGTTITNGTLNLNHRTGSKIDAVGENYIAVGPGTLRFNQTGTLGNVVNASTGSVIAARAGVTATLNGFISVNQSVTFGSSTDTGTIVLAENTFSIQNDLTYFLVGGGTLKAGGGALGVYTSNAAQTAVRRGATLDFNGGSGALAEIAYLTGNGKVTNSAGATTKIDQGNFTGIIAGAADLEIGSYVKLAGASTLTGTVTVDFGATLVLTSAASVANAAGITVDGTLSLMGNTLGIAVTGSGRVSGYGTLSASNNGTTMQYAAGSRRALTFTGDNTFGGFFGGAGAIVLKSGSDTFASGLQLRSSELRLDGADVTLDASNNVRGGFNASAGTLDLNGNGLTLSNSSYLLGTTITGGGALYTASATSVRADTSISSRLGNSGTIYQRAGLAFGSGGYFTNAAGATDNILGDFDISASRATVNAGLIEKTAGRGTSTITGNISNDGVIGVSSGTLKLANSVGGTGTLGIEGSSGMELGAIIAAGQTVSFGSGVNAGNGLLTVDNAAGFRASISGFGRGDRIALTGFDSMSQVMFEAASGGGGGGTLTVADGAKTFSAHLDGTYNARGFSVAASTGGETIRYAG